MPTPPGLKVVARGIGGVNEMSLHLDETKVFFGVFRFVFGKGTFARTKYVAVHFNGESCPTVKRGRANARKIAAMVSAPEYRLRTHRSKKKKRVDDVSPKVNTGK